MKIGIFFESTPREGGAFHANLNIVNIINEYNKNNLDITYIVRSKDIEKLLVSKGCKCFFFQQDIFFRILNFLSLSKFFSSLINKLGIQNKFEKILKINKFDLIYFNSPTLYSTYLNEIPFVMNIYEMQHKTDNYFPEYRIMGHSLDTRDLIIKNAISKAFKIIVATKKDKNLLKELYNSADKNVEIQPYVPQLPNLYENDFKNVNFTEIFLKYKIEKKNIFFYPAQFWSHKNHRYIIDIALELLKNNLNDFTFIFTGHDKGNKSYIKTLIQKNKLEKNFLLLDYVDNKELISLYLNSNALIMPTFVGHSTLPLYEAFYFNLPVFFTKGLLDDELRNYVYEIDIFNPHNFLDSFNEFKNNKNIKVDKTNNGKKFYEQNCKKINLFKNLTKIFKDYQYLKNRWS
tara:strand:+ start:4059 stop:5267 length:1209 start_codon:yes stop_codon:yes gene_type:complete